MIYFASSAHRWTILRSRRLLLILCTSLALPLFPLVDFSAVGSMIARAIGSSWLEPDPDIL